MNKENKGKKPLKFFEFKMPKNKIKKVFVFVFCFFILLFVFNLFNGNHAFAASVIDGTSGGSTSASAGAASTANSESTIKFGLDSILDTLSWVIMTIATLFLKITIFLLSFVIELGGYNGYLDSPAVNIGWVMVRDIANMFFVAILLLIAFGTILGIEQYEWRKMLVKFVLAAILVNFSRIICGVIIDVAQVIMVTFINGVAATAGGNLINAFSADQILKLSPNAAEGAASESKEIFMASVLAVVFSAMMMVTIGVYMVMLLARMIVLWVLIVLSPLAFVLSVVPQTQKYASQWWEQFGNNVISGPIIVFFLWLSFATVGGGDIHDYVSKPEYNSIPSTLDEAGSGVDGIGSGDMGSSASAGISKVTTWDKMANFFIAIGMLLVGAKVASQLGVVGGQAMSKAGDFGKKVGMMASGYTAGRYLAKGAAGHAADATNYLKKGLFSVTLANPLERAKNWAKTNTFGAWGDIRNRGLGIEKTEVDIKMLSELEQAQGIKIRKDEKTGAFVKYKDVEKNGKMEEEILDIALSKEDVEKGSGIEEKEGEYFLTQKRAGKEERVKKDVYDYKKQKKEITKEEAEKGLTSEELERGASIKEEGGKFFKEEVVDDRGGLRMFFHKRHEALLKSRKVLKRVEESGKVREELMGKRISAKPDYLLKRLFGDDGGVDALDRIEQGMLDAEKARSEEKTAEFKAYGRRVVKGNARFKEGKFEKGRGTISEQIQTHKAKTEWQQALEEKGGSASRMKFAEANKYIITDKEKADMEKQISDELMKVLVGGVKRGLFSSDLGKRFSEVAATSKIMQEALGAKEESDVLVAQRSQTENAKVELEKTIAGGKTPEEAWKHASVSNPSLYAAQQLAERDENYTLYRGRRQEMISAAEQDNIWSPMGIATPDDAANEVVVEGYYKTFQNMPYSQAMSAHKKHLEYVQKNNLQGDWKQSMIAQAIFKKIHEEAWVDDLSVNISNIDIKEIADEIGKVFNNVDSKKLLEQTGRHERSKDIKLNIDQVNNLSEFIKNAGISSDSLSKVRGGDKIAINNLIKILKKEIPNNHKISKQDGMNSPDKLLNVLKNLSADIFSELIKKIK